MLRDTMSRARHHRRKPGVAANQPLLILPAFAADEMFWDGAAPAMRRETASVWHILELGRYPSLENYHISQPRLAAPGRPESEMAFRARSELRPGGSC